MRTRLSDYAISHLVLVDIDRRFEAVIKRNPKRNMLAMRWRIQVARDVARHERDSFPAVLNSFNYNVHGTFS